MRTLVFEPDPGGHHFQYASLMLPAIDAVAPRPILVTTGAAAKAASFDTCLGPIADRFELDASLGAEVSNGSPAAVARARLAALRAVIDRQKPDHVYLPYLDGLGQTMAVDALKGRGLAKSVQTEGLYFRCGVAYPLPGGGSVSERLRRRLAQRISWELCVRSPITVRHHLDPLAFSRVERRGWSIMPDPVEQPAPTPQREARRALGMAEDGRVIGCAGVQDRRKGIDLLIEAFAAAGLPADHRLLLVGPQAAEIKALLAAAHIAPLVAGGRIHSVDRFVAPIDLARSLRAMDLVCTPYPDHIGSASIVIRAAAADRPVLGSDFGWVGRTVPQFALGWTCNVRDRGAFVAGLRSSLERAAGWRLTDAGRRFVEFHSPANFAACWTAALRKRLGVPPEPNIRSWSWVLEAAPGR